MAVACFAFICLAVILRKCCDYRMRKRNPLKLNDQKNTKEIKTEVLIQDKLNGKTNTKEGASETKIFREDKFTGQGEITEAYGTIKKGEFKDGKLNGQGKQIFPDKATFEGEFKDNKLNGQGKKTRADGTIIDEGEFKDGNLVKTR